MGLFILFVYILLVVAVALIKSDGKSSHSSSRQLKEFEYESKRKEMLRKHEMLQAENERIKQIYEESKKSFYEDVKNDLRRLKRLVF